ncbi:MAG: TonB-dependent receptor [Daejeonella sp.]
MNFKAKTHLVIITLLLLSTKLFAQQTASLTGKLIETKTNAPLEYAAIVLSDPADSSKRIGGITNQQGEFNFKDIKQGNYVLKITSIGFKTIEKSISISNDLLNLGTLKMEEDAIALKEVAVTGRLVSVKVKKDTLEFNANAFKTKPNAAVEDLLKKLPGVEIDKDGNILVQGQKVSRLTVDGKDFFGTDPKTATKNLPADAISKVQIVDSKTLEAKATGIDDGQREKVLNLTIKEDKKKGWFGNATIAGGTTDKYNGYISANHFNKNMQFALLGMSNNINNASFAYDDLSSFTGGNIGTIFSPPAGGNFSISVNNGKTTIGGSGVFDNSAIGAVTTHSGGLNYSNTWGKKSTLALSSSYFTYFSKGIGNRFSNIQDLSQDDILRTAELNNRNSDNQAHRFNFKAEYHPDSLTDVILRPNVILNNTTNSNNRSFNSAFDDAGKANDGTQYLKQKNFTPSLFGEFSVLRRMANKKGSVSLRLNGTQNTFNSDWVNRSLITDYTSGSAVVNMIDQQANQENNSKSYTINAGYVRPVFNSKWNANLSYIYNSSTTDAQQATFDYNTISGKYETIVPDFTNTFNNHSWLQAGRLGFIYTRTDWTFNFGAGIQQTGLDASVFNSAGLNTGNINKKYMNVLPRLAVNYKNKANQTLQINYNGNVNLPSVNDLQPVQNNSNPLYQRMGNPDLDIIKSHRLSVNFNTFSPDNNKYWNGYFLYNLSFDDVANDVKYTNGIQYIRPVNVDGNYYISTGTYLGMPAKLKGLRMGTGVNINVNHRTSFINTVKNITDRYYAGPNAQISYDIEGKWNTGIYLSGGYSIVNNSTAAAIDNKYFSFNNSLNLSYEFIKSMRIDAQVEHVGRTGRAEGFNTNTILLNAGIEKDLMEKRLTLSLKGYDILKQNVNIDRSVNNGRIEDVRYSNLTRYFYLSLNYKIAKVGAKNQRSNPRNTVN